MIDYLHDITKKNIARGNGNIYSPADVNDCSKCITTKEGQRVKDNFIEEPFIVRSVGRNPENPSDRTAGIYLEQRLESNLSGCSNALTTVQKDNLVAEPQVVGGIGEKNFGSQYRQGNRIYDSNAIAMSLLAQPVGNAGGNSYLYKTNDLRIRKLTPKECWRLMGFDDADFDKAAQYNSNTQLYKQAGNSIVVDVLCYIFREML
jgi:site-specific DNA-cytosine methylase